MSPTKSRQPDWDEVRTKLRREQILEAATRVFSEKGYHRATTKDIAREAGMAEGTIYLYFESKADLLVGLIEYFDQATTQSPDLKSGLELSMRALLTHRLEADLAQLGPHFDLMVAILPEVLADPALRSEYYTRLMAPTLTGLTEHLITRQTRGEAHVTNPPMAARIFTAALLGLEIMYILGDETVRARWQDPKELARDISEVMLDGLQTPPEENHDQ